MYCSQCGAETNSDARFCQYCGAELKKEKNAKIVQMPQFTEGETRKIPQKNESAITSSAGKATIDQSKTFLGGTHHPWRRFFARSVDILILGVPILLIFFFLIAQNIKVLVIVLENQITAGMILYILWIPVEAAFISTLGTTPAKWIFGISVLSTTGKKLSYAAALKRAFLVWVQGEGLSIPVVALFTRLLAYQRLTKTGTTLWDISAGSVVTHKKWGIIRTTASVIVVLISVMILGILNS
jgi:uncharacterized RDD family membrane protein YckC